MPLRHRLPSILFPLAGDDEDLALDLPAVFNTVRERPGYDYPLDYRRPVEPALSEADAGWAQQLLAAATSRTEGSAPRP